VPTVFVVADAPSAAETAAWLSADVEAQVRSGDGTDDTLLELQRDPADVVVLDAGLSAGDALAFVNALRADGGKRCQLVLVADEAGLVRNALDALPFRADRFLRRPLSRSALVFAVRSCLQLGSADIVRTVAPAGPAAAFAILDELKPAAPLASAEISSGVARHALAARIDAATRAAIDAFLDDELDGALRLDAGEAAPDLDEVAIHAAAAPFAGPRPTVAAVPPLRDATVVLPPAEPAAAAPVAPDEANTGTFVSAMRRHMSAVEARLFGDSSADEDVDDSAPPDIDLDAIGVTAVTAFDDAPAPRTVAPPARTSTPRPEPAPAPAPPQAAPSLPGDLADEDVASLFARLAREQLTGRVVFRSGDAQKTVCFDEGRPVFASSSLARDRMGELLVREGKITRDQVGRARDVLTQSGRRMGEILVDIGFLKRRELLPAVRRHLEDIIYSLFAWDRGGFAVSAGGGARDEKIRLAAHPAAIIVEGIRRKLGLERLRALVGPLGTVLVPGKREELTEALAEADLAPEERQTIELFDGQRSLAEVAAASALPEDQAYQLAHALLALGLASRNGTLETGRGAPVSAPGSSITGAADVAIDRERVRAKHGHVLEADYFEILGVRRDATGFEIRRAYESARRDYAPESFAPEVQRELAAELAEIGHVLAEAQRVLRDDEVRGAYVENLKE
jgi:DNA-binding NarL/FixJ family response regulator